MAGSIDEYTFLMMIEQLDVNHDGIISKEEFKVRMEVIQKILEHPRADTIHLISHPDKGGRTVAHYAAIREEDGDDVLFKLLKKHGANFEAIDHGGNKPATLAAKAGRKKSKELLEEALVK